MSLFSYLPSSVKEQLYDQLVESLATLADGRDRRKAGHRLRRIKSDGGKQAAVYDAISRGVDLFLEDLEEQCRECADQLRSAREYWLTPDVMTSLFVILRRPEDSCVSDRQVLSSALRQVLSEQGAHLDADALGDDLVQKLASELVQVEEFRDLYQFYLQKSAAHSLRQLTAVQPALTAGSAAQPPALLPGWPSVSEPGENQQWLVEYLTDLVQYASQVPGWFPPEVGFDIRRDVGVVSVPYAEAPGSETSNQPVGDGRSDRPNAAHTPTTLAAALRRFKRVLILDDPGSGKSWAVRGRALEVATQALKLLQEGQPLDEITLPLLVLASKAEDALPPNPGLAAVAAALLAGRPSEVSPDLDERLQQLLTRRVLDGTQIEVLIDGFDEIRAERPSLALALWLLAHDLNGADAVLLLTTRLSTLPPASIRGLMQSCELERYGQAEQLSFVETWFAGAPARAGVVNSWLRSSRLDMLRSPLLLALLCSVASDEAESLPATEGVLWERALSRFVSDQDRAAERDPTRRLPRLRMEVLQDLAHTFISDDGIREQMHTSVVEELCAALPRWQELSRQCVDGDVIEDLVRTGLVRHTALRRRPALEFLHSSFRDYLLAKWYAQRNDWGAILDRIWSQPEWEPVLRLLAPLLDEPLGLLGAVVDRFHADPFNAARFCAGQIVAAQGPERVRRTSPELYRRVVDELVVLAACEDDIDRARAASLLAYLVDAGVAERLVAFLQPWVPTRLVRASLTALGSSTDPAVLGHLTDVAQNDAFVGAEREAAVEALAASGSVGAPDSLAHIAADRDIPGRVRAAAAAQALRSFDDLTATAELLHSGADEDEEARRLLAERIALQPRLVRDPQRRHQLFCASPDRYCRHLYRLRWPDAAAPDDGTPVTLTNALPTNPALNLVMAAFHKTATLAATDPVYASHARFISRPSEARSAWLLCQMILDGEHQSGTDSWNALLRQLPLADAAHIADHLADEILTGPERLSQTLRDAVEAGHLDVLVARQLAAAERVRRSGLASTAPAVEPAVDPTPAETAPPAEIADLLSDVGDVRERYQQLHVQRRSLDREHLGQVGRLTAAVSALGATSWIDAQPGLALTVERRLVNGERYSQARLQLASLRSIWPRRAQEVRAGSLEGASSAVLETRAEAALLDDRCGQAHDYALAALGAGRLTKTPPGTTALRILTATANTTNQPARVLAFVRQALNAKRQSYEHRALRYWLELPGELRRGTCSTDWMPNYLRRWDAEAVAARMISGEANAAADPAAVASWSRCRRVISMIEVVQLHFAPESAIRQRLQSVADAFRQQTHELAETWPAAANEVIGGSDSPYWYDMQAAVAAQLLEEGELLAAQRLMAATLEREPNVAALHNNLGFCLIPTDRQRALQHLEKAASRCSMPEAVNVANRMLCRLLDGDLDRLFALAETWWTSVEHQHRPSAWLWAPDSPGTLLIDQDPGAYILDLAVRESQHSPDARMHRVWQQHRDHYAGRCR